MQDKDRQITRPFFKANLASEEKATGVLLYKAGVRIADPSKCTQNYDTMYPCGLNFYALYRYFLIPEFRDIWTWRNRDFHIPSVYQGFDRKSLCRGSFYQCYALTGSGPFGEHPNGKGNKH